MDEKNIFYGFRNIPLVRFLLSTAGASPPARIAARRRSYIKIFLQ
jgi:hypothetical protein